MRTELTPVSRPSGFVPPPPTITERTVSARRSGRSSGELTLEKRLVAYALPIAAHELKRAHPQTADAVVESFSQLVEAVSAVLDGLQPRIGPLRAPVAPSILLNAFADAVLELTDGQDETLSGQTVLRVLRAIRRVQQLVATDPTQSFVDALSGARGLDMVVEVTHDMRSPLTSILFLVETLRSGRSGSVNPVQERQLGLVYGAAFGLSAMANDVIELARGGERLLDASPMPFSLAETIGAVRDIVRPIAEEKELELRICIPERDARIGFPAAVSKVLLNLTTNALKFTSEGWVEVGARQLSHTLVAFEVRDTGPGVPEHVQASLFSPFRPNPYARTPVFSSAGLGLSICRRLVQAMGSNLVVESAPGQGTRFYFELDMPIAARL
jgi:signal transduction histidine kinase